MTEQLTLTRIVRAARERVFAAWTQPAALQRWWGPGPVTCPEAHVDLRVGGIYRIANLEADGSTTWIEGEFHEIAPPESLVYSWRVSNLPGDTLVRVNFNAHPDGTELVLTHERFAVPEIRDGHALGWTSCLDKLEAYLANG